MSESDSSFNFADFSSDDDDITFPDDLYENLIFYLICQEPEFLMVERKSTGKRDRSCPLNFIHSWTDKMFHRQFRTDRQDFQELLDLMIAGYPGDSVDGWTNYCYDKAMADKNYGHIALELKLYITLRLLSGASYLDMVW